MVAAVLWPTLLVGGALGMLGVYLLLPRVSELPNRVVRGLGLGLLAVSLLLLGTLCLQPEANWRGSLLGDWLGRLAFSLFAGLCLISATATITSRSLANAIAFFLLTVLANAGLFWLVNAQLISAATVIIYSSLAIFCSWVVTRLPSIQVFQESTDTIHEPVLGCVAGSLLAVVLIGASHFTLSVEAVNASEARSQSPAARPAIGKTVYEERRAIDPQRSQIASLGLTLFRDHWLEIEILGAILLVALVSATLIVRLPTDSKDISRRSE